MRNKFLSLGLIVLSISSVSAYAEVITKETIPAPVLDQFYKKHPNALDVIAEKKTHFKQGLIQISYKEEKDKEVFIELYRTNGKIFVSADDVTASNVMPAVALDNLKAAFNKYSIKKTILVPNPNGVGEDYDLIVNAAGVDWSVVIDYKGNIIQKVHN